MWSTLERGGAKRDPDDASEGRSSVFYGGRISHAGRRALGVD
jgi:hypothetical protein